MTIIALLDLFAIVWNPPKFLNLKRDKYIFRRWRKKKDAECKKCKWHEQTLYNFPPTNHMTGSNDLNTCYTWYQIGQHSQRCIVNKIYIRVCADLKKIARSVSMRSDKRTNVSEAEPDLFVWARKRRRIEERERNLLSKT